MRDDTGSKKSKLGPNHAQECTAIYTQSSTQLYLVLLRSIRIRFKPFCAGDHTLGGLDNMPYSLATHVL